MIAFTIPLPPVPASRPRVSKKGWTYYVDPYKSFKDDLKDTIPKVFKGEPIAVPVEVQVRIFATQPKATKLPFPKPDVDNYAKAIYDGMNELVLEDDWLIQRGITEKFWAKPGQPGFVEVKITTI